MDNMCRICQQTGENAPLQSMMTTNLLEVYSFCTNIPITEDNEKCYKICEQCAELLIRFNDFKKLCIESDNYFKQNACVQVKLEFLNEPLQSNIEEDDDFIKDDYSDINDYPLKEEFDESDNLVNNENNDNILNKKYSSKSKASNKKSASLKSRRCCKFCSKKFVHAGNLKRHYLKCNKKVKKIKVTLKVKKEVDAKKIHRKIFCKLCSQPVLEPNYKDHLRRHAEKPFECVYCGNKYIKRRCLNEHVQKFHLKNTKLLCPICPRFFYINRDLKYHLGTHSNEKPYECDLCHKKFRNREVLKTHLKNHSTLNKCNICNEYFSNRIDYANHMNNHMTKNPYKCKVCEIDFIFFNTFQLHVKKDHPEKQNEDCIEDLQQLQSAKNANNINKIIHSGLAPQKRKSPPPENKKNICNFCGKHYKSNFFLVEHIRIHTGEKPFACDKCDYKSRNKIQLKYHQNRIHDKLPKYQCSLCSFKTYTSVRLSKHMTSHFDEKPYVCDICDSGYKTASSLSIHKRSHTGEKPYSCTYCDKQFTSSAYLRQHLFVHTGEKKYSCNICDKKFNQRTPLTRHLELHKNEKKLIKPKPNTTHTSGNNIDTFSF